jgi:hypothetical protein
MKNEKIKVGDLVTITKVGISGCYVVESIEEDSYTVVQKEGTYVHKLKIDKNEVKKL